MEQGFEWEEVVVKAPKQGGFWVKLVLMLALGVVLAMGLVIGLYRPFIEKVAKEEEMAKRLADLEVARKECEARQKELDRMQKDTEYVETTARDTNDLAKPEETVIRIDRGEDNGKDRTGTAEGLE